MKDFFEHWNLSSFPEIDKVTRKNDIITATKTINNLLKNSRAKSKLGKCYYCGTPCDSFCNSHTSPAFCLRNIAKDGKVFYANSILDLPTLKESKGVNESGTFHLICRDCDSKIFQDYENPDNYNNIPTTKMLAQIDMKNNLKNISKRLIELELYGLMGEQIGINDKWTEAKLSVSDIDLAEYKDSFSFAKKRGIKPLDGDYYIGYYQKLSYVVPIAFQGSVAMIFDLDGSVINNVYNPDTKYKIKNVGICIFPLKESSVVMLFVDKENKRYSKFFRQLKKLDLEDQLSVINYIIFAYTEDYFLSPNLDKKMLKELIDLFGKTPDMIGFYPTTISQKIEGVREIYDFNERFSTPNLLTQEFSLSRSKL